MKLLLKWFPLILVSSTMMLMIILNHQAPPQVTDSKFELQAIQHAIEHTPTLDLSPIKAEVAELAALIKQRQVSDASSFNTLVGNIKTEIQNKLDSIATTITALEEKEHPVKILPASSLPFKVLSIDSLQNISVATISYAYKTTALEVRDALAGWQVKYVDFATQNIVFENTKGEVHLQLASGENHA